jgi:transposase InsO family protein
MAKVSKKPSTPTEKRAGAAKNAEGTGRTPNKAVPRSRGTRYGLEFKRECLKLLAAGMTLAAVEAKTGVSTVSLGRWKNVAKEDGSYPEFEVSVAGSEATSGDDDGELAGSVAAPEEGRSRAPKDNIAGLSDEEVAEILKLKKDHAVMGPAQIRAQLKRFMGWRISVKAIARVLRANGFRTEHRTAKQEQELQRFEAPRPNALWQMDALSLRVHKLRVYLHLVIDDFSRFIVGHRLSETITSEDAVATLEMAIEKHGKPERVLTDRGGQFLAVRKETSFRRYLEQETIDHSVSRPYHPQTIGKVESVNRAIQKELIYVREFATADEMATAIDEWVESYNLKRAHMGIDGLTPADRYFGLQGRVLAEVQARSRKRQSAACASGRINGPLEELGDALEVLRLVLVDGRLELRFCGLGVELGRVGG